MNMEPKASARRPYFQLRGKQISEEQALAVISRADRFFDSELEYKRAIDLLHFPNWWFNTNHYPTHYGWCHPSGIIGLNGITDTYPELDELIEDMLALKCAFPWLDFVAAITNWDESPPYKEADFLEAVEIGIWSHDGAVEFMGPRRAREKYREYEALYGGTNQEIYKPEYYMDHNILPADVSYLKRCIETYGFDPDEILSHVDDYVWKGLR